MVEATHCGEQCRTSVPGLLLVPVAVPGRRRPEGLQRCSQNALKEHGNVGGAGLALHVPLMPLALPRVLQRQQQQPEACSCTCSKAFYDRINMNQ